MEIFSVATKYLTKSNHSNHSNHFFEFINNFKQLIRYSHGSASCIIYQKSYPPLLNNQVSDFHLLNADKASFAASS